jgi:hypothetical protein
LPLPCSQLWHQQPGESSNGFALFQQFLDLNADCTLPEFAEKTGKTFNAVRCLSSRHHWFERAAAWRQHLAALACDAVAETKTRNAVLWASRHQLFREQEWELAQQSGAVIRQLLLSHLKNPDVSCSISEISNFLHVFSKLGRLASEALADPTEPVGNAGGSLSKEISALLAKLFTHPSEPLAGAVNSPGQSEALPAAALDQLPS